MVRHAPHGDTRVLSEEQQAALKARAAVRQGSDAATRAAAETGALSAGLSFEMGMEREKVEEAMKKERPKN